MSLVSGLCAQVLLMPCPAALAHMGILGHVCKRVWPNDVHDVVELQHGVRWRVYQHVGQGVLVVVQLIVSHSGQTQVLHAVLDQLRQLLPL